MANLTDALIKTADPERVYYEVGVMLNAEDFQAEQDYHRGRLARALQYVVGTGTLAGLSLEHEPAAAGDRPSEERLRLKPGVAVDGFGRLIEVQRDQCIRLARWLAEQNDATLRQAWHAADAAWVGAPEGIIADLSLRFTPCERGKTASFAKGPFDGLDAVTADRVRDGFTLTLAPNVSADPALPPSPWQSVADAPAGQRPARLRTAILGAWANANEAETDRAKAESVFLARVVIEAPDPGAAGEIARAADEPVRINNDIRPFVVSTAALATLTGTL